MPATAAGQHAHHTARRADHRAPHRVAVVGAGMVGLSTAWFLQERGVEVTVIDREGVAAGSSWGNAGWLTPGITTPLPEPAVLKYGVRAVLSPNFRNTSASSTGLLAVGSSGSAGSRGHAQIPTSTGSP